MQDANAKKLQKLREKFLDEWIVKKSRMPFKTGNRNIAFFCREINFNRDNTFSFGNGTVYKSGKRAPDPLEFLEAVSEDEAKQLNALFYQVRCTQLVDFDASNFDCHTRQDTNQDKVAYEADEYHAALFRLKVKYPEHNFVAYQCPLCEKIHIGKQKQVA